MTDSTPRRLPRGPEEGWLTVSLVVLMMLTLTWSIDDAGWVLGRSEWTDFLPWTAVGGVAIGFIGAQTRWNRWLAHLIGAILAALIVPILVGGVLIPHASPGAQFVATATASVNAWSDLIVHQLPATRETGHHLLVLGLLCWATGQFAASAVFRHRRPLSAVVVIGTILIGNMSATVHDQLGYLIVFSLAALFLLIRLHALDEQSTWVRRRIGDPSAVGSIYLRGGTVFIVLAVVGALVLTTTARSSPLAGAWDDLKPWLINMSAAIQKFLPVGGDNRGFGTVVFGPVATIRNIWTTNDQLAVTIQRPIGDKSNYYWRVITYDRFNLYGWDWSGSTAADRGTGEGLLDGTLDQPSAAGTSDVVFKVTPDAQSPSDYALSPTAPIKIDRPSKVALLGDGGFFEGLQIDSHGGYTITASVPVKGDETPGGLTGNILAAAGTAYPKEVKDLYLDVPDGAFGPESQKILDKILVTKPSNPYDLATATVNELHSADFVYDTDVLDVDCGGTSVSECFAFSRHGYCEHYATLMAMLLRHEGVPTRFVHGYLPGSPDERTGIETITNQNAHAWVEVYFPGHGWYPFDPTGGGVARADPLPSGRPVATPSAGPSSRASLPPDNALDPTRRPGSAGGPFPPTSGGSDGPAGYIIVSLLLLSAIAAAAFLVWRRGPRGPTTPEGVYAGVARLASRLGFGPRPTQTAYEYAAALGDVLPDIRPELQTVATAKVEVAYGGRTLGEDRIKALGESYRRLRVSLLRLVFRRGQRGRR
jgi:transglutaminase-like putative cysteine protease